MILTVTPTPAIDVTYSVEGLQVGSQMRSQRVIKEASGKGVNVSAALAQLGHETRGIVAVSDDAIGHAWVELADALAFALDPVVVSAGTRLNTTVKDASGQTTRVNEPVAPLHDGDVSAIVAAVARALAARPASWVVCSGSLPPDSAGALVAGLTEAARAHGARIAFDTSGAGLQAAAAEGVDLLKPNEEELQALIGQPLTTRSAFDEATMALARRIDGTVLTTLGADGAIACDRSSSAHAHTPTRDVVNTAGAGDATLAGFLAHDDADLQTRVETAVQWGLAACLHDGTVGLNAEAVRTMTMHH